jgi:hypothetical protein
MVSQSVTSEIVKSKVMANVQWANFGLKFKKADASNEVAICIPSEPMECLALNRYNGDMVIRDWWEEWKHNISDYFQKGTSLFLVTEITHTPSFTNCYYRGCESETTLAMKGKVGRSAEISLGTDFKWEEFGRFGFKSGTKKYSLGNYWTVFIRCQKNWSCLFKKMKPLLISVWQ